MDHGDHRLPASDQRAKRRIVEIVVAGGLLARGLMIEFGDIGAGRECLVASACEDNHTDLRIGFGLTQQARKRQPHGLGPGVKPGRIIADEPADSTAIRQELGFGADLW